MTIADTVLACGMCVFAGWGAIAVAAQYVKYRNARRSAEAAAAESQPAEAQPSERQPQPQPA
ncbi:MAG: hypothetical protein NTZ05_17045 [Chloroflexi bacterium]|nr:hypothetical protein [Chloroflexota bacterium]